MCSIGTFTQTYVDAYITLNLGQGAYIGNRSIVVHTLDTKRYACANITVLVAKDKTPITSNSAGNIKPVMGWAAAAAMGLTVLFV